MPALPGGGDVTDPSGITFYVITAGPSDWPEWPYVVRPQRVSAGRLQAGPIVCLCPTLAWARAPFLGRLIPFPCHPSDDPVLIESWMA